MNKTFGFLLLIAGLAGQAFAVDVPLPNAPEIDPGSAVGALSLLAGGLLVLRVGRKKK